MSVSNEDREAAADVLRKAGFVDPDDDTVPTFHSAEIADEFGPIKHWAPVSELIAALVSHGWGPKPAVDAQRLNDLVTECTLEVAMWPLTSYLESCGIEVSDG